MSTPMRQTSTRVLDAEDIPRAWGAVRDLSRELGDWERWSQYPAALSGWWGGAMLHLAYHNRIEPSDERAAMIGDLLDHGMSAAARMRVPSFYGGMAGLGWGLEHASRLAGDECEIDELDEFQLTVIERDGIRDHELIGGLVGVGFYGIERIEHEKARNLVAVIVRRLEDQAHLQLDGVAWRKRAEFIPEWQREKFPEGCWNLGLSHGIPGVISFLCYAARNNVCADIAAHLVEQSVPWLIKQYFQAGGLWHLSSTVEGPRPEHSRLAWCYNELGACMPILEAADVLKRDDWRAFAADVLENVAPLTLAKSGVTGSRGVPDPAICHGIAGVAHLFAHSARRLQNESLYASARAWMKSLLDSRSSEHGLCGFPRIGAPDKVTNERPIESDPGFLEGASGVGLVLLAALADEEPGWNRILGM